MYDTVHFRLTHNGQTRRFTFTRSNEECLLLAVKLKTISITGPLTEREQLVWRDTHSINHPLETPDDLSRAIKYAIFDNEKCDMTSKMEPCVRIEVIVAKDEKEEEDEWTAASEEVNAVAALLALTQSSGFGRDLSDLPMTIARPDVTHLDKASGNLDYHRRYMADSHKGLQNQYKQYLEQQKQAVIDYQATLRQNEADMRDRYSRQLSEYKETLRRKFTAYQNGSKLWRAVKSCLDEEEEYRLTLEDQEKDLARDQRQLMVAHLLSLRQNEADYIGEVRETVIIFKESLEKVLNDCKEEIEKAARDANSRTTTRKQQALKVKQQSAAETTVTAMLQKATISEIDDFNVEIVLPDVTDMTKSQQSLMAAYHEQLKKQLFEYKEQQRQTSFDFEEYLRQNVAEYADKQRKELARHDQLVQKYQKNERRWKGYQAVETSHRKMGQRQHLIKQQKELMAEHMATMPPLKEDLEKKQKESLMESVRIMQKALDDYKLQLMQKRERRVSL